MMPDCFLRHRLGRGVHLLFALLEFGKEVIWSRNRRTGPLLR
jgi:hypothetical protein